MPYVELTELAAYKDERGNEIRYTGHIDRGVIVRFRGSNNTLVVDDGARFGEFTVNFDCDNGLMTIGASRGKGVPSLSASVRIGQDSTIRVGRNVSSTGVITLSATEGTTLDIGDDVMFASRIQVRADDGHVIFDVKSGKRVNVSQSITIGDHVWLAVGAVVLGGVTIGSGSVIGINSLVSRSVPNNCIAVGVPAKVVRKNIAWERPHTSLTKPFYKPDVSTVQPTRKYWRLTEEEAPPAEAAPAKAKGKAAPKTLSQRVRNRLVREYRRRVAARR